MTLYIGPDGAFIEGPVDADFLQSPTAVHTGDQDGIACWYPAGAIATGSFVNQTLSAIDVLYALPLIFSRTGVIDQIGVRVAVVGGAGSKFRIGLYEAKNVTNIYPGRLVVASGEFDGTVLGVKTFACSVKQTQGLLLWAAIVAGTVSPQFPCTNTITPVFGMGISSSLNTVNDSMVSVAFPYAALPDPFPAGAARANVSKPLVSVHYSS